MGPNKIKNIIFPIEFNHFTGGMIHSVMDLAKALTNTYNVYVLANKDAEVLSYSKNIKQLQLQRPFIISISSPWKSILTHLEVRELLSDFNSNDTVVITNNVGSELIISGFGFFPIPLSRIFVSRGGDYKGKTGLVIKWSFRSIFKFIATSRHQENILKKTGVPLNKIIVIHNGIDININNYLNKEKLDSKLVKISIVGYINKNKNQLLAIKVINKLHLDGYNVVLNVYGNLPGKDDRYLRLLNRKINELGIHKRISFHGFVTDRKIIYENTDILLSCSLSEGFGRVVVEAMAFGIPCIGMRDSGGLKDIIENNVSGFLTDTSVKNIAHKILVLIQDDVVFKTISKNARKRYLECFTKERMIRNYMEFLEKL